MSVIAGATSPPPVADRVLSVRAAPGAVRSRIVRALHGAGLGDHGDHGDHGDDGADLLVLHCEQIGSDEVAQLRSLHDRRPAMRIVVVCAAAGARHMRRAVDGGADGLVLADRIEDSLTPTIAAVLAGQVVVPGELGTSLPRQPLTFREKQTLSLAVAGYTNAQISAELFLAESTIKSHLSSVFTKLGVASRSEAAALVLDPRGPIGLGTVDPQWRPGRA